MKPIFPPVRHPTKRPAALILGLLSGCMAAIAILPTAFPLIQRLQIADQAAILRHVSVGAGFAARTLVNGASLEPGSAEQLQLTYLRVESPTHQLLFEEGSVPPRHVLHCEQPYDAQLIDSVWAVNCIPTENGEVIAVWKAEFPSHTSVLALVVVLALIVGIVTALGVLRILSPLSQLSGAIVRVGAGERGVSLPIHTGLSELDELVEQLNSAARAMEDREDAILARIKAVQDMARMVAHEVRNPLQSLELLTSLISSEPNQTEREELSEAIRVEIRMLDQVVTRVLREGAGKGALHLPLHRNQLAIAPIVDHVLAIRKPEARAHGITLERGAVADIRVWLDGALIGRSIENMMLNAIQAVPPSNGRIRLSAIVNGPYLDFIVEDNGPGVMSSLAEHIFEPNVTGRTGGTGLGLALVKEVVEAHRGIIISDRSPLGGARFTLRIPLEASGGNLSLAENSHR